MTLSSSAMIDTVPLLSGERSALLALLAELSPDEWASPTACPGWSVKDIAAHLFGDDVGVLGRGRDGHLNPDFATGLDINTLSGLIAAIDRQNAVWVEAMRRVSPPVLIDLLRLSGDLTDAYFRSLDLRALGGPVDWAGPDPAPIWVDVAREYTERWMHQQHIRDAVNRPGFTERHWFAPVLAAFMLGLPRVLAAAPPEAGDALRVTISGEAGGVWLAQRDESGWTLGPDNGGEVAAMLTLDQDDAWRLFTRGLTPQQARQRAQISGNEALAARALETVSILAE